MSKTATKLSCRHYRLSNVCQIILFPIFHGGLVIRVISGFSDNLVSAFPQRLGIYDLFLSGALWEASECQRWSDIEIIEA